MTAFVAIGAGAVPLAFLDIDLYLINIIIEKTSDINRDMDESITARIMASFMD